MTFIRIIASGLSTIQDGGRHGYSRFGVPSAGAFDTQSYALLCNLFAAPAISCVEILDGEFVIRVEGGDVEVAVIGGAITFTDGSGWLPDGTICLLRDGQEVAIRRNSNGPAYVGVFGLINQPVLTSCSFDTLSRLGPPPLLSGATLITDGTISNRIGSFIRPDKDTPSKTFRIVQSHYFDESFASVTWRVASVTRSGVRLSPLEDINTENSGTLPSIPVHPGCIQTPSAEEAIILGPDSGVTGGYSIAAAIISADLAKVSHLTEGENISFESVTVEEATTAWKALQNRLSTSVITLQ